MLLFSLKYGTIIWIFIILILIVVRTYPRVCPRRCGTRCRGAAKPQATRRSRGLASCRGKAARGKAAYNLVRYLKCKSFCRVIAYASTRLDAVFMTDVQNNNALHSKTSDLI